MAHQPPLDVYEERKHKTKKKEVGFHFFFFFNEERVSDERPHFTATTRGDSDITGLQILTGDAKPLCFMSFGQHGGWGGLLEYLQVGFKILCVCVSLCWGCGECPRRPEEELDP